MKNKVSRVVIDTNLLIAAYFNKRSASFKILEKARKEEVKILWTESIKKEGERILNNIKANQKFRDFLNREIFRKENKVEKAPKIGVVKKDPADNKFLACAQKGKANLIVTNDHHLLDLKKFKRIPILTPTQAIWKLYY